MKILLMVIISGLISIAGGSQLVMAAAEPSVIDAPPETGSASATIAETDIVESDLPDDAYEDNPASENPGVAASLAAGLLHSAMINYDGRLYIWGDNKYGQLGLGTLDYSDTPQLLNFPGQVVAVSLGSYHSLAVLADGSVWSWGRNAYGQLGIGNIENTSAPVQLSGLPPIVQVAAGAWHSLALGTDGSVWAWGNNTNLQIGDVQSESITDSAGKILGTRCPKPVRIVESGAAAISAGGLFSMYLDAKGQVFSWGDNQYGQLGDGTTQAHAKPVQIQALSGITGIAAGYQHALAVSRQGGLDALLVWGDDSLGQLGIGSDLAAGIYRSQPERLDITGDKDPANDQIVSICAGYSQSAVIVPSAIKTAREAAASAVAAQVPADQDQAEQDQAANRVKLLVWGNNASGQLALGKSGSQNQPVPLSGTFNSWTGSDFLPFDALAFGGYHMLALSSKGLLAAAGRGDRGQLGNQSVLDRKVLVPVSLPDVIRPAWLTGCSLSAQLDASGNLLIRWPAAQDNRSVAGYRVRLRRADGEIMEINAGSRLSWIFNAINIRQAHEIMVMAYDADSADAESQTLSRLTGWIRPEGAADDAKREDYFSDWNETVWQVTDLPNNWQPDPQGLIQPLEVPWDVSSIYGQQALPRPADWRTFWQAGLGALILLLITLLDIWRRQNKRRRQTADLSRQIKRI